jgi:hypothetical protein
MDKKLRLVMVPLINVINNAVIFLAKVNLEAEMTAAALEEYAPFP